MFVNSWSAKLFGKLSLLNIEVTYRFLSPDMPRSAFTDLSVRYFIVFSSLSVHVTSSTSPALELERDGRGKMKSATTCSTTVLDQFKNVAHKQDDERTKLHCS